MFNVNRNGWFHFRLRIPYDLTDIVGFTHIQAVMLISKSILKSANTLVDFFWLFLCS